MDLRAIVAAEKQNGNDQPDRHDLSHATLDDCFSVAVCALD